MSVDLRNNIVAQYKMNDNLATTNVINEFGIDGTNNVNTNTKDVTGKINGALTFNGSSDFLDTKLTFQSTFKDSFSINFWFNTTNIEPGPGPDWIFGDTDVGGDHVQIFYIGSTIIVEYKAGANTANNSVAHRFNIGQWHMITMTFRQDRSPDSMQTTMYIDSGEPLETSDKAGMDMSIFTMTRDLYIGANNTGAAVDHTNGKIDNFCIFNKTLTQREIDFLYNDDEGTEELENITGNIVNNGYFSTMGDYSTRNDTPANATKLVFSSISPDNILRTANNQFDHVMVQGVPLSVSACLFKTESEKFITGTGDTQPIDYFYALDVIAAYNVSHQTLTDEERITRLKDTMLYVNRWNAINYLNTAKIELNSNPKNLITLFGSAMTTGEYGELVFNETSYTIDDVEEFKEVAFETGLVSVGRIGNKYYLIITT